MLEEDYLLPLDFSFEGNRTEYYVLNDDEYLVLGDNRLGSYDSRGWGSNYAVSKERIEGVARAIVWPVTNLAFFRAPAYE